MIQNSTIQKFLRSILLAGMEEVSLDIPILYENIISKNKKDTYIVEALHPLTEFRLNERVEEGSGVYKITIFSNRGEGLKITDTTDIIASFFVKGEYVVNEDENIKVFIQDAEVSDTLFNSESDKIQRSVSVSYNKYQSK